MLTKIHMVLCHSEIKRSGIELMAELLQSSAAPF
jgi:hypothetical protein